MVALGSLAGVPWNMMKEGGERQAVMTWILMILIKVSIKCNAAPLPTRFLWKAGKWGGLGGRKARPGCQFASRRFCLMSVQKDCDSEIPASAGLQPGHSPARRVWAL